MEEFSARNAATRQGTMGKASRRKRVVLIHSSQRMPVAYCPECMHMVSGVTGFSDLGDGEREVPDNRIPQIGDITMCAYCRAMSRFVVGMQLKRLSPEEEAECLRRNSMARIMAELDGSPKS